MSAKPARSPSFCRVCYQSKVTGPLFALPLFITVFAAASPTPKAATAPRETAVLQASGGSGVVLAWNGAKSATLRSKHGRPVAEARVTVDATSGQAWALVRWGSGLRKDSNDVWAFVPDGPNKVRLVWQGNDGAQDSDGEIQTRVALGAQGLMRFHEASWLRRCDGQAPVWRSEFFDVGQRKFVPSAFVPWQATRSVERIAAAVGQAPLLAGQPWPTQVSGAFVFTSASTPTAANARALPAAPDLSSNDGAARWSPFAENAAGAAFVTARASAELGVTGFALMKISGTPWPASVVVHSGRDAAFTIDLAQAQGDTVWAALPTVVATSCLTFDFATPAANPAPALRSVQIVTALDGDTGADFVVRSILNASDCGRALLLLGPHLATAPFATKLVSALPSASQNGQACGLQALAVLPIESVPDARSWLPTLVPTVLSAAEQPGVWKESTFALWLARGEAPAAEALGRVVLDESQTPKARALAAKFLVISNVTVNRQWLVNAAGMHSPATNSIIRSVLAQNLRAVADILDHTVATGISQSHPTHAADILWLRAKAGPSAGPPPWWNGVVAWAKDTETPFEMRARSIALLGVMKSPPAHEILLSVAVHDSDAVVRHLSFEALAPHAASLWNTQTQAGLVAGLADADPRVRQSAARAWASLPRTKARTSAAQLLRAYQAERWPFAMAAHLSAIAGSCIAEEPLVTASSRQDLPTEGKVAALEGLAACNFSSAREQALFALKRQTAPIALREAAAQVLQTAGKPEDAPTLLRIVKQSAAAASQDPSLDDVAAAALQTLVKLDRAVGGEAAMHLLGQTRPRLRRSGMTTLGAVCTDAARALIEAELTSTDAWLASAARGAKSQCEKTSKTPS